MAVKDMNSFFEDMTTKDVTDLKNPDCNNCNDCCGIFTIISDREFEDLKRYFNKNKLGRAKYELGVLRVLNGMVKHDALYLRCPLSLEDKKCDIYKRRPGMCRDFHCDKNINKVDNTSASKKGYGDRYIFELFKDDLMKNEEFYFRMKELVRQGNNFKK
ncbi:MAG: YkgJ family cysteine cluster protein [Paraclostridium sp.]